MFERFNHIGPRHIFLDRDCLKNTCPRTPVKREKQMRTQLCCKNADKYLLFAILEKHEEEKGEKEKKETQSKVGPSLDKAISSRHLAGPPPSGRGDNKSNKTLFAALINSSDPFIPPKFGRPLLCVCNMSVHAHTHSLTFYIYIYNIYLCIFMLYILYIADCLSVRNIFYRRKGLKK